MSYQGSPTPPQAPYQQTQAGMVHAPADGWWAPKGMTPDGRRLAGPGRRFGGLLLDGLVQSVPLIVLGIVLVGVLISAAPSSSESNDGEVPGAFIGAIFGFYGALFLVSIGFVIFQAEMLHRRGATLGMRWVGLRCIDTKTGGPISRGKAYGRCLFAAFISGQVFGLGYWYAFMDDRQRTAHDLVCGTVVVDTR